MQLLNRIKSSYKRLNEALQLYSLYLAITFITGIVSLTPSGEGISEGIASYSEQFEPLLSLDYSFSQFFANALGSVLAAYLAILAIQIVLGRTAGKFIYLVLGTVIGLAGGIGGGLATYTWSGSLIIFLISQLEWIGGAFIVNSGNKLKFNIKELLLGVLLISLSLVLISLILFN